MFQPARGALTKVAIYMIYVYILWEEKPEEMIMFILAKCACEPHFSLELCNQDMTSWFPKKIQTIVSTVWTPNSWTF